MVEELFETCSTENEHIKQLDTEEMFFKEGCVSPLAGTTSPIHSTVGCGYKYPQAFTFCQDILGV